MAAGWGCGALLAAVLAAEVACRSTDSSGDEVRVHLTCCALSCAHDPLVFASLVPHHATALRPVPSMRSALSLTA